jgi:hypothetical protein
MPSSRRMALAAALISTIAYLGGQLTLEEECWASWKRALSPRWHGHTWLLVWRLVFDLWMLGLRG